LKKGKKGLVFHLRTLLVYGKGGRFLTGPVYRYFSQKTGKDKKEEERATIPQREKEGGKKKNSPPRFLPREQEGQEISPPRRSSRKGRKREKVGDRRI